MDERLGGAPRQAPPTDRGGLRFWTVLGVVLALALAVRLGVSQRAIWLDEAYTFWEAHGSPFSGRVLSFNPLPALTVAALPAGWDGPVALRLPFVLLGVLSIAVFAVALRLRDGVPAGLAAGLLLAVSPYHVLYSSEARMYAWVLLAAGVTYLCLVLLQRREGVWAWLGYVVAGALGVSAHPFTATLVVAQGGYLLVARRDLLRRWCVAAATIAAASAPAVWYGLTVHGVTESNLGWIHSRPLLAAPATLYGFVLGNAFLPSPAWWLLVVAALVLVAAAVLRTLWGTRPWASLVAWSAVAPVVLIVAASAGFDLYSEQSVRYLACAQPFLLILVARGALRLATRARRAALLAAVTAVFLVGLAPVALFWEEQGMGAHDRVAERIRAGWTPGDMVVAEFHAALPLAYYFRREPSVRMVRTWRGRAADVTVEAPRVWYVALENRSMTSYLRAAGRSEAAAPPPLAGYRAVRQELFPGRKPITVTLMERAEGRVGESERPPGGETAVAGPGAAPPGAGR